MTMIPRQSGSFSIKRDEIIFTEGNEVQSLDLLLQGKAEVFISPFDADLSMDSDKSGKRNFRICSVGQSIFLGGSDLFLTGNYSYSCKASEDSNLYAFAVKNTDEIKALISSQKDYGAYIMNSLCTIIDSSYTSLNKIVDFSNPLRILSENLITYFWVLKEKYNFEYTPSSRFLREGLDMLQSLKDAKYQINSLSTKDFFEKDLSSISNAQAGKTPGDLQKIEYYRHLGDLTIELRKSFFSADSTVTCYQCSDAADYLNRVLAEIKEYFVDARDTFTKLYKDDDECIFSAYLKAAEEISATGSDPSSVFEILDYIIKRITETVRFYETEYQHTCDTDLDYLQHTCSNMKATAASSRTASGSSSIGANAQIIPEELMDSARKIVQYSGIAEEKADLFLMNLFSFRNMPDKLSTSDDVRNVRNKIASLFFEIYEAVFKKAYASKDKSRLIEMFLLFGYMDEKLLTPDQVLTLYRLTGKQDEMNQGSICTMKDWLTSIYELKSEPSIGEFGQDYNDIFREMRKRKEVTDKDKSKYDSDIDAKLTHEVANLFKINQKLCHGQINVYFPILHSEMITRDLSKTLVTAQAVIDSINRILEVDYSAFHREVNFRDADKGIEKESIMKPVYPDIILVPTFGCRAVMWQEIAGRNRSNPGRFLLPLFTDESLDELVLKLIGNFRWELCRTIMGSAWNDVTEPSLTSEYSDYTQFFKKNKDLTDEAKEKLKVQIQKYHGKTRDIFTADYETWINHESKGSIRLNKVVRSMMYRYCPLAKPLREHLEKSPIYSEVAMQFKISKVKLAKELEGRYRKYASTGPLDPALEHNLKFYKEM